MSELPFQERLAIIWFDIGPDLPIQSDRLG